MGTSIYKSKYILLTYLILISFIITTCLSDVDEANVSLFEPLIVDSFEGKTIYIKAEPNIGWKFSHWVINNDSISNKIEYTFIMPPTDINVIAIFIKNK